MYLRLKEVERWADSMAELGFESRTRRCQNQCLATALESFSSTTWPLDLPDAVGTKLEGVNTSSSGENVDNRSHSAETFSGDEQDVIKPVTCYDHPKDHLEMGTLPNELFRWCRCPCLIPIMSVFIITDGWAGSISECLQNEQLGESEWPCSLLLCRLLAHTRAFFFLPLYFFNWRIIALQNFVVFVIYQQRMSYILYRGMSIDPAIGTPVSPPFWTSSLNLPPSPSPSHPSRLSQSPCLSSLGHTANSCWLSTLHMVL